jgi:chitin synthase
MLAAFFEWVLWLGAFIYCLVKVYTKADYWSIRVMAVVMIVLFSLTRYACQTSDGYGSYH